MSKALNIWCGVSWTMAIEGSSEMGLNLDFEGQVARNHLGIKSEVSRKDGSQGSTTERIEMLSKMGRPQSQAWGCWCQDFEMPVGYPEGDTE